MEPFTALLYLVASTLLALAFAPTQKRQSVDPREFDEGSIPQADEGTRVIEVFGDVNIDAWTVLGYGDRRTKKITAKQMKGKKK